MFPHYGLFGPGSWNVQHFLQIIACYQVPQQVAWEIGFTSSCRSPRVEWVRPSETTNTEIFPKSAGGGGSMETVLFQPRETAPAHVTQLSVRALWKEWED